MLERMLLLKQRMNVKLRNSAFSSKRDIYAQSNLLLTKKVAEFNEWTKETIEERQNYLAKLAVQAWKIKP